MTEDQSEDVPVVSEDMSNLKALKQSSVLNQLLYEEKKSREKSWPWITVADLWVFLLQDKKTPFFH